MHDSVAARLEPAHRRASIVVIGAAVVALLTEPTLERTVAAELDDARGRAAVFVDIVAVVALFALVEEAITARRLPGADWRAQVAGVTVPVVALLAFVDHPVAAAGARPFGRQAEPTEPAPRGVGHRHADKVVRTRPRAGSTRDGAEPEIVLRDAERGEIEAVVVGLAGFADEGQVRRTVVGAVVVVDLVSIVALLAFFDFAIAADRGVDIRSRIGVGCRVGVRVGRCVSILGRRVGVGITAGIAVFISADVERS